jgi:hypothetical protein
MIYASTAFSGADVVDYDERLYDWRETFDSLMKKYENNQMDDVNISPFANNYAFSKRITELLIDNEREKIPFSIVRPSIVTPSYTEPFGGWIDSYGGIVGPVLAVGSGSRTLLMKSILKIFDLFITLNDA